MSHATLQETSSLNRQAQRMADKELRQTAKECGIEQAYLFARLINKADAYLKAHPILDKDSLSLQEAYSQAHIRRTWKGIRADTMTALQGPLINPSNGKLHKHILTALTTSALKSAEMAYQVLNLVCYLQITTQEAAWNTAKVNIQPIIDAHRRLVTGRRAAVPPLASPPSTTGSTPTISSVSPESTASDSSASSASLSTGRPPLAPAISGRAKTGTTNPTPRKAITQEHSSLSWSIALARAAATPVAAKTPRDATTFKPNYDCVSSAIAQARAVAAAAASPLTTRR